jgi:hypothetical protein
MKIRAENALSHINLWLGVAMFAYFLLVCFAANG